MYQFIDINAHQSGTILPSEALKINGVYIEEQIEGYRTLYVKGREAMSREVVTAQTETRDGAEYVYGRYPERMITVGYLLAAGDNTAFRAAYNKLNAILSVEESQLVFADESDKYFTGTVSEVSEVDPGKNTVRGEITFLCADPFKYSLQEYEITPTADDDTTFVVQYNGTYKSYPVLEASMAAENESDAELTGSGDCGYIAFLDENEHVIQLGDPDETEGEALPASQTLVNQTFNKWDLTVTKKWVLNNGTVSNNSLHAQTGAIQTAVAGKTVIISASSYGTGAKWHGPTITRTIPADESGAVGSANFRASWKQILSMGTDKKSGNEKGAFQALLVNTEGESGKVIAGIAIWKSASGTKGTLRMYVNGRIMLDTDFDLSHYNRYFGWDKTDTNGKKTSPPRTCAIQKKGSTITFNVAGFKRSFTDPALEETKVHQMTFYFAQYGTNPTLGSNGLYWAKFIADQCTTWQDIPNKFSSGDVVTVDCNTADITLNDAPTPELGALGNDYEQFYLSPGVNQIGCVWSEWASRNPTFKMRYREVYL